jgi:hypothetical protein
MAKQIPTEPATIQGAQHDHRGHVDFHRHHESRHNVSPLLPFLFLTPFLYNRYPPYYQPYYPPYPYYPTYPSYPPYPPYSPYSPYPYPPYYNG